MTLVDRKIPIIIGVNDMKETLHKALDILQVEYDNWNIPTAVQLVMFDLRDLVKQLPENN